ncbi:MAG: glycosyltransferase family 2 protein [Rhodospirillales bacterium]|nr:glycosyltransferase family 2 protein [Rhodospirillales bacterium]
MSAPDVSVIITTKNEEVRLPTCLEALGRFDDVWVVDSYSEDQTCAVARARGVRVIDFQWDGRYPKKRQWCLDRLDLKYEFVFFVDADEILPPMLIDEIAGLDWCAAGYFVKGFYEFDGLVLRHGLCNNKLALFDRRKIAFPVVNDLDLEGMGEIEGHYQPVLKAGFENEILGQLKTPLLHRAYDDAHSWEARHLRYACWEAGMNAKEAWPIDPKPLRQALKKLFRNVPFRPLVAFIHCYVWKLGFLDGQAGYRFACSRVRYYRMISDASKALGPSGAEPTAPPERL